MGAHDAISQIFKMANENLAWDKNFDILVTFVGLKTIREIPMQKMVWKKMTRFRRAARTLYWDRPLWNQAQKFFMHMKIKIDPILGQNLFSHWAIFDIEVGVDFEFLTRCAQTPCSRGHDQWSSEEPLGGYQMTPQTHWSGSLGWSWAQLKDPIVKRGKSVNPDLFTQG